VSTVAEDADDGSDEAYHIGDSNARLLLPGRAAAFCRVSVTCRLFIFVVEIFLHSIAISAKLHVRLHFILVSTFCCVMLELIVKKSIIITINPIADRLLMAQELYW